MHGPFVPPQIDEDYEIHEWRHAIPLLATVHPEEWNDILAVLGSFRIRKSHINVGGKGKSNLSSELDGGLYSRGWIEKKFQTAIELDGVKTPSPTHKIDCFKNRVALELEWNNKTEFYDRDLNNFRLLFELRAIDLGVVVTRCDELQKIFDSLGRGSSYGKRSPGWQLESRLRSPNWATPHVRRVVQSRRRARSGASARHRRESPRPAPRHAATGQ